MFLPDLEVDDTREFVRKLGPAYPKSIGSFDSVSFLERIYGFC